MDKKYETKMKLRPGFSEKWKDIKLTVTSITIPPMPALGRSLITDGSRHAIITKDEEKLAKRIFCPNIREAEKF